MVESLETQQQLNRLTFDDIIKEAEVRLNMGQIQFKQEEKIKTASREQFLGYQENTGDIRMRQ